MQSIAVSSLLLGACDNKNGDLVTSGHIVRLEPTAGELFQELTKEYGIENIDTLKQSLRKRDYISYATQKKVIDSFNKLPNNEIHTVSMERVRKGPLGKMKKIGHNLRTLLGGKYADSIMYGYNKELIDTLFQFDDRGSSIQWVGYDDIPDTQVPRVYPALQDFLVPSLKDFLAERPEMQELVGHDSEVIIITRNTDKKHVFGYYRDGRIDIAQYMSAGIGKDLFEMDHRLNKKRRIHAYTPTGVFYTNYAKGYRRDSTYSSKAFSSAMPYTIPISTDSTHWDGVALHTGFADGDPRSHQCNRLPGWLAMYMFDMIGDRKVKVVIHNMYDKVQNSKSRKQN